MDAILATCPAVLQAIFEAADHLARQTGFVRRLRKLRPAAFARTFTLDLVRHPKASLDQSAAALGLTASALTQRLARPAAAAFLLALLRHAVSRLAATLLRPVAIPLLRRFNGVYLVDGTVLPLPAALAGQFPGCGGGTGPDDPSAAAAVKVLLRWRLDTSQAADLLLAAATTPDVRLLATLPGLPAGALHIGDLGFFDGRSLAGLTEGGVYWLTRLPARVGIRAGAGPWQELAAWLRDRAGDAWEGRLDVVQVSPVSARVFVRRCPPDEAARRRRKLHDRMRRKGQTAGWRQAVLCDWWVLATNAPPDKVRAVEAWDLYRARWQIELVFKRWKSLGGLPIDRRHTGPRAECELYGKLLGVLVVDWLAVQRGGALAGVSVWRGWQIVWDLLPALSAALATPAGCAALIATLVDRLDRRRKPARRRKTPSTRQRLFRATLAA
jgi:hypothetical protein